MRSASPQSAPPRVTRADRGSRSDSLSSLHALYPREMAASRERSLGQQGGQSSCRELPTETRGLAGPKGREIIRSGRLRLRAQRRENCAGDRESWRVSVHRTEFSGEGSHRSLRAPDAR